MTTKIRSVLNQNALGPGLALDQGGLVVTTTADNLDQNRKVLGTVPRALGELYYECAFYSTTRPTTLPVGVRCGIALAQSTLDTCCGDDIRSLGFELGTGKIYNAGVNTQTITVAQERTMLGVHVTASAGSAVVSFFVDGVFQATETFTFIGGFYVPCITVCGSTAADMNAYFNSGIRGFRYPLMVAP